MDKHYLTPLFAPETIGVFAGRQEDEASLTPHARAVHEALRAQRYTGRLVFLDIHTTGTLADLAQTRADLAVIALPPDDVASALEVAGRMACRVVLVISSGIGPELAADLKKIAQREGVHLLGPNCLGIQRPALQLNASAAGPLARAGSLALVSQSGALTASILDWARNNAVGFSSVVSLGPNTAVDIAQVLDYLANDPHTHSIVVYLEGISSARTFMSALRSAANAKPVVVLKAGRKPAGNEAAQTHSGTIVGSDDVFDAALRRAGAPSSPCFRRPSAWLRATGPSVAGWPSSPTAAARVCWRRTGSMRFSWTWASYRLKRSRHSSRNYRSEEHTSELQS